MRKKYGIQIKGLGRALRPSGLGVLRPKPRVRPRADHSKANGKVYSSKDLNMMDAKFKKGGKVKKSKRK